MLSLSRGCRFDRNARAQTIPGDPNVVSHPWIGSGHVCAVDRVVLRGAAVAQRTFVASTGNDANPCSLAQPCRGFAAAGSTVNAAITASVARNAIHRNARTAVAAEGPGGVIAVISENSILLINVGLSAVGNGTVLAASANSFLPDKNFSGLAFEQVGPSRFLSYGNNIGHDLSSGFVEPITGF